MFPRDKETFYTHLKVGMIIVFTLFGASNGLRYIPLSFFAIILNLKPMFVVILGFFVGIEKLSVRKVVLILLSF